MLILYSQVHGDPGGRWLETLIINPSKLARSGPHTMPLLGRSRTIVIILNSTRQKSRSLTIVSGNFLSNLEPPKFVLHVTMSMYVTFLVFRWLWLCGGTGPGVGL